MKKRRRNPHQHIVDYYDRLLINREKHPPDPAVHDYVDCACGHEWYFHHHRHADLLAVLDGRIPSPSLHTDPNATLGLYKYPVSKEHVQSELDLVRRAVRSKNPSAELPFALTELKPNCRELRLDYMEYHYVLSHHPHFDLWDFLRAMMWYYHKRLPIEDPLCDVIEDNEFLPFGFLGFRLQAVNLLPGKASEKQKSCIDCLSSLYMAYFDTGDFPLKVMKENGRLVVRPDFYRWEGGVHEDMMMNDGLAFAPIQVLETLRSRYV